MCPPYRPDSVALFCGNRRTDSRQKARDGSNQGITILTLGDAENILSHPLSHTFSTLVMPFLKMLPVAFLSRITEIIYDQPEKRSVGISWNNQSERKKEVQMSMDGFDAALPFTRDKTRQWGRP